MRVRSTNFDNLWARTPSHPLKDSGPLFSMPHAAFVVGPHAESEEDELLVVVPVSEHPVVLPVALYTALHPAVELPVQRMRIEPGRKRVAVEEDAYGVVQVVRFRTALHHLLLPRR